MRQTFKREGGLSAGARRLLSVLLALGLLLGLLPATAAGDQPKDPELEDKFIYANGTALILAAGDGDPEDTVIYLDRNADGVIDAGDSIWDPDGRGYQFNGDKSGNDLSGYTIFGGGTGDLTLNTKLTMLGGKVSALYGGGRAVSGTARLTGEIDVAVLGGTVTENVFGGGANRGGDTDAPVEGNISVRVGGSANAGYVYGGGGSTTKHGVTGSMTVTVDGDAVVKSVYGSGNGARCVGTTQVTVTGRASVQNVYGGGGNGGTVILGGDPDTVSKRVAVSGSAVVSGEVRGGGSSGSPAGSEITIQDSARVGSVSSLTESSAKVTISGGATVGIEADNKGISVSARAPIPFAIGAPLTGAVYVLLEGVPTEGAAIATGAAQADLAHVKLLNGGGWGLLWEEEELRLTEHPAPSHAHAVGVDCSTADGTQVAFTPWSGGEIAYAGDGGEASVYLTGDVALDATLTVPAASTLNLCLDGHVLKGPGGDAGVIQVAPGAALNLCDCNSLNESHQFTPDESGLWVLEEETGTQTLTGGVITGGTGGPTGCGGGVFVGDLSGGAAFHLYGGNIAGNHSGGGGGVCVFGSEALPGVFTMWGGAIVGNTAGEGGGVCALAGDEALASTTVTITGTASIRNNTATGYGGGVSLNGQPAVYEHPATAFLLSENASITDNQNRAGEGGGVVSHTTSGVTYSLSGSPRVTGNLTQAAPDNFRLWRGQSIAIGPDGLGDGASIGVTASAPKPFNVTGANTADCSGAFFSDSDSYTIRDGADHIVQLAAVPPPHTHSWAQEWSRDGGYHWHDCAAADCPITENAGKEGYGAHSYGEWQTSGTEHWKACTVCGGETARGAHVYDGDGDASCNTCGYLRTIAPKAYTVSYDANGGSGAPADLTEYASNGRFTIPDALPTRDGYAFRGWRDNDNEDLCWPGTERSIDGKDHTLVAQWGGKNLSVTRGGVPFWYATLEDAFRFAPDGAAVRVEQSYADGTSALNERPLTLDLNGKTITGTGVLYAARDMTLTGDGGFTGCVTHNGGALTVESGTFGCLLEDTRGTLTLNGGTFTGMDLGEEALNQRGILVYSDTEESGRAFLAAAVPKGKMLTGPIVTGTVDAGGDPYALAYCQGPVSVVDYEPTYELSGSVTDSGSAAIAGASVRLMRGSRQIGESVLTDARGTYRFTNIPAGLYNVVASKGEKTMTILVALAGDSRENRLTMPAGNKSSLVKIEGSDTPAVVAGGVERVAASQSDPGKVVVTLRVEQKETPADKELVDTAASGKTVELYLDLSLLKQVDGGAETSLGDGNTTVLEIVLPYDLSGKNVTVYRVHQGSAAALKNDGSKADGTYQPDPANNLIRIFASKFSTYAIAYSPKTEPARPSEDGGSAARYQATVDARHGSVVLSPKSAGAGTTVTATVTPDAGYELEKLTVTDQNGRELTVTRNGDGTYSYPQPIGNVTVTAVFRPKAGLPFTDVAEGDWFYESVRYVSGGGLMNGTSGDRFSPSLDTSRGMLATILWRQAGAPETRGTTPFQDVAPGAYYAEAVAWGVERGILQGYDNGCFGPDDPITREQLAALLYRFARVQGLDAAAVGDLSGFADQPSEWAAEAVRWAVGAKILSGRDGGVLDPRGRASRAETAAMLTRFLQK